MAASLFSLPAGLPADPALLATLLDLLPMGVMYYTPVMDAAGTLTDLALAYLNPAAQRMTRLPAQPGTTYRQQFPTTDENGAWDFHRRSWLGPEPGQFQFYYEADGFDNYFRVTAQRLGEGLLVVFTGTQDEARSQAEEALRANQAREQAARAAAETRQAALYAVFEQAPVAISLLQGPAHVIEFANSRMAQLWGRSLAQVAGQAHFTALPELAGQGFEEILGAVWRTGEPYYLQEQLVTLRRAGQPYQGYFNIAYQPSCDGQGQRTGVLTSAIDVTEQVVARQQVEQLNAELETRVQQRTQEALALQAELLAAAQRQVQQREELYQVFEQAPVVVGLLREPEHFFHYCNPAFQALFPGRALTGRLYAEAMPEIVAAGLMSELDRVYATGQPYHGTALPVVTTPPDGTAPHQRYYDFSYQPYREASRTVGVSIFAYDVTEQVLAQQERETRRQLLATVFAQAPAAIWVAHGPDYVFELVNAPMAAMLGRPSEQLLGRPLLEEFPELRSQGLPELLAQAWTSGEPVLGEELPVQLSHRGLAEAGYFSFVYQPLRDEHGQVTRIACVTQEVTTQVLARQQVQALNAQLTTSNEQLTRTNADLDTFVYAASHDLKAPIANIEGLLTVLREYLPTEAQEPLVPRLVGIMEGAISRFQQTVGHLTDISRLQNEHTPKGVATDLAAVLEDVRLDLLPLLESTQAELVLDLAACPPVALSAKHLRSVLFNLLSNAVKYRAPDRRPRVQVRSRCTAAQLVLEVQDNGLGLTAAQRTQLFSMFRRLHTHVEGSGVGLYLIKRTLENAGGSIAVESEPGIGSTFTAVLPQP